MRVLVDVFPSYLIEYSHFLPNKVCKIFWNLYGLVALHGALLPALSIIRNIKSTDNVQTARNGPLSISRHAGTVGGAALSCKS